MPTTTRSLRLAVALAAGLTTRAASAQTSPDEAPPPPPPAAQTQTLQCPACVPDDAARVAIDRASELMAQGRAAEARQVLRPRLSGTNPWARSYDALSVLDRLAVRLAAAPAPTTPTALTTPQSRDGLEAASVYTSAILLGVGTGVWIDAMAEIDDVRAAVIAPLLLGGVGAGALYLGERLNGPLRRGRGTAMSNGVLLGALAGTLFGAWGGSQEDWSGRAIASTVWGGAVLGLGVGLGAGALTDITPAAASFVGSGGIWGSLFGLGVAMIADVDSDGYLLGALTGELAGVALGAALTGTLRPTEAQVHWMDLGFLSGGLVGTGLAVLIFANTDLDSPALPAAVVEASLIGGGILGYVLGRPRAPSSPSPVTASARDRFRVHPAVAPTQGGGVLMLSMPQLL